MNNTPTAIFKDMAEHPNASITEIAGRTFLSGVAVRHYLIRELNPYIIKTQDGRGSIPARYSVRQDVDWCPRCGQVME